MLTACIRLYGQSPLEEPFYSWVAYQRIVLSLFRFGYIVNGMDNWISSFINRIVIKNNLQKQQPSYKVY